jgi:hypothetical protein
VDRGGFTRPAGTAMSPLEYAVVLSAAMPLALSFAFYDIGRRPLVRWAPAALIGTALLLSSSRSALLGLGVGVVVMFPRWSAKIRVRVAMLGIAATGAMFFLVPGMIGTLRYLFINTSQDPSALSRSGSYGIVEHFVNNSPLFGRGFGTFLPQYRILDNEYLLLLVEIGVVGVLAFVSVIFAAASCAAVAIRRYSNELDRQFGQALAASVLAVGVLAAFFDALSFPMAAGCIFLCAGLCGGFWRLSRLQSIDRKHSLLA